MSKQGYHFVGNGRKLFLESFDKKLFLEVLTEIKFFFCKLLTMANILRILKKILKILFFDGAE